MAGLGEYVAQTNQLSVLKETLDADHVSNDLLAQIKDQLIGNNQIQVETSDENTAGMSALLDATKEMAANADDNAVQLETGISSLTASATKNMAGGKNNDLVARIKSIGSSMLLMTKLAAKEYAQSTKVGKIFADVGKQLKKQGEPKTTVIQSQQPEQKAGGGKIKSLMLNSKMIASAMGAATLKALNPVALVTAFLTKVLPLIVLFGLFLFGFIKGYMNGTIADALIAMTLLIVAAVAAYIAYLYIKEAILYGIKIACEMTKVAIAAAANWAAVGVIIAMVAVIGVAFLLAAALIIVIVGAAIVGVVVAMYFLTKAIKGMMEDMIDDIASTFDEQLDGMKKLIAETIGTFTTLVPIMSQMMNDTAASLKTGVEKALSGIQETFKVMTSTMDSLASEISKIFNGLAAAILASAIGKAVKQREETIANTTINSLTAQFKTNPELIGAIAAVVGQGFLGEISSIISSISSAVGQFAVASAEMIDLARMTLSTAVDGVISLFNDAGNIIIGQTILLISKIVDDVNLITGAFVAMLTGLPIVGWLMGLVGANSFAEALQPLTENSMQIKNLTAEILDGVTAKRGGFAKSQAVTNTVANDNTSYIESSMNTLMPTDGESLNVETTSLSETPANFITPLTFNNQLGAVRQALKDVVDAIYKTAPENEKKGLFGWLW